MFVFKATYQKIKNLCDKRTVELNDITNKLRQSRIDLQTIEIKHRNEVNRVNDLTEKLKDGENSWDKAKADIGRLRESIQNYSAKTKELADTNKTLFARAGGFAQQFKSMQKRILTSSSLKELKKHVESSLHRAEQKRKRETAAA